MTCVGRPAIEDVALGLVVGMLVIGDIACRHSDADGGAPPPTTVEETGAGSLARVDHPEQFPVVTAEAYDARRALTVTGVVSPDITRNVPVLSLASGRAVEVHARLGDKVQKGDLLLRIHSADISGALSDYRHAVADEVLARAQFERSQALFEKGAIAQKDLEVAQDVEDKAKVDLQTTIDHLHLFGLTPDGVPNAGIVDIVAPISGVITEQNITAAGGVRTMDNSPNLFTISDTSRVWIVCDVYENDLPAVHVGDGAEIHVNAYPDRILKGRVNNILPILDPSIRTAKVRVEVTNPGFLSLGMFATAVFREQKKESLAVVPASAILHLHDREWVYEPDGPSGFKRIEVTSGEQVSDGRQEVRSGVRPGDRLVANALVLQNSVEQ